MLACVSCVSITEAIERPGDAENAKALRRSVQSVTAIQKKLLARIEAAPRGERFELYRIYDDSMGTWLQVRFLRTLLDASIIAKTSSSELRLRMDLRDHARYTLWELDQNIAHLDAGAAEHEGAGYLRLIKTLRSSSVSVRTTVARLAAEP